MHGIAALPHWVFKEEIVFEGKGKSTVLKMKSRRTLCFSPLSASVFTTYYLLKSGQDSSAQRGLEWEEAGDKHGFVL